MAGLGINMHFLFAAEEDGAAAIAGVSAYKLQLVDGTGRATLTLRLPADLIDSVIVSKMEYSISMAPDGAISGTIAGSSLDERHTELGSIDTLVADALQPSMLEDEPDGLRMLTSLRDRLARAIALAENAIAQFR